MADQDLSKLKVTELREMLKARGLNSVGNKQELIDRLHLSLAESSVDLDSKLEDELLNDDELDDDKSLLDSTQDDILKSPSGSAKSTSPESSDTAPKKPISLKRNISVSVPIVTSTASEIKTNVPSADEPEKKVVKLSQMSAQERLEMRAKKFGASLTTSVSSVDNDEKKNARAARFGTTTTSVTAKPTPESTAKNVELLKKRAERFGTVLVPELKASENQEKLLKRQERFGISTKTAITMSDSKKSEYEEKALKRLERFKTTA